jgi:general secretion pathway protein K
VKARNRWQQPRNGFALLAVLSVMAVASVLAMLLMLAGRDGVQTARNRVAQARALWLARGCAAEARATIDGALRDEDPVQVWRRLDTLAAGNQLEGCQVTLRPSGMHLDANVVDAESLRRMAGVIGIRGETADSLAAALEDWRDGDDEARPLGAERDWYRASGMIEPRNGPLQSVEELKLVRGFEGVPQLDSLLAVGDGRIWLTRAPAPVIAALPGFTADAVDALLSLRSRTGDAAIDLGILAQSLGPDARQVLASQLQRLAGLVYAEPESWALTSESRSGLPPVKESVELRLVRAGRRAAVVNRREWP